jgi:hypothetical protein
MFTSYDKALAALVMAAVFLLNNLFGLDIGGPEFEAWVNKAVAALTPILVFAVPNRSKGGGTVSCAPLVVLAAMVVSLAALSGCASLGVRSAVDGAASPELKVYAAQQDFRVTLAVPAAYEALPRCQGAATSLVACSNTAIVAGIRKAVVAARDALDQAEAAALAGQPDAVVLLGSATSVLNTFYAVMGSLVVPAAAEAKAGRPTGTGATGAGAAPSIEEWRRAAAALRDLPADAPTGAATESASLAIVAGMKGLNALLVALPVGTALYADAKQTKAFVEEMAKSGAVPSPAMRAEVHAARDLVIDAILAD